MAVYAVDAGGTRIKLGVVQDGTVLARTTIESHSKEGLAPQLPRIVAALRQIVPTGIRIEGLGMAFPSLVDPFAGKVIADSAKYSDAQALNLSDWTRKEFGIPFAIENDARMAAIGEWRHGAGRGSDDVVMVTLGTGIGTGVIMGGRVLRGAHGQAGCLGGHLTVRSGGRLCFCGNLGCSEAEASTATLAARAAEDPAFAVSPLHRSSPLDYSAVLRLAEDGDPAAVRLRDHAYSVWGSLAVSLIHAYDPEVLVFGGGILAGGETVLSPVREYVAKHAWTPWGKVRVVRSELGDDAALVACEWLVKSRQVEKHEIAFA